MNTYYSKKVDHQEYLMYRYINNLNLNFVPKLYSYDKITKEMHTQKINGNNISYIYGENIINIPNNIKLQIYNIINELFNNNIIYPDITGYNFIEDENKKLWIVDFGHSFCLNHKKINKYTNLQLKHLEFINNFIDTKDVIFNKHFY